MKKLSLLLLTLTVCFFTACHKDIWAELENLDQRVTKLEELCKEMNTNITSLQTIVSVLQSNDFITGIIEIKKNGEVIGYTITFGKHDPITIYHGQDGKDGADGKDGQNGSANAPVIGVAKDTDGVYYWTLNGEWLLDDNGNKLPVSGKDGQNGTNGSNGQDGADGKDGQDGEDGKDGTDGQDGKDGITPQLKIEDGYWYISYDNGATWTQLGKATGEDGKDGADGKDGQNGADGKDGQDGDSMFQSVTQDENYVYFTLADGTVIKIAKGNSNDQPNGDEYIDFKDLDVKYLLLTSGQNIDLNKDNQISYDEAAAFRGRLILQQGNYNDTKTFKSFTEFKYFINVTSCEIGAADLFEIEFPDGLDSIMSCKGKLQSIKIPQGCRYIASNAFCKHGASETNSSVSHIIWNDSIEYIGRNAFGTNSIQLSELPNSIKILESGALYVSSQTFTFTENLVGKEGGGVRLSGVQTIYWNAINFREVYGYTQGTYSYRGLGGNRGYERNPYNSSYDEYDYDTEIKKVNFGEKVKAIPESLCTYLDGINEVIIPDNVEVIGASAFYDCRNLTTVTIGSGVREIGAGSFITGKSTSKLTKIYCKAKTPPALKGSLNSTLPSTAIIYVPRSSVEEYRIIWSDYADKIVGYDFE